MGLSNTRLLIRLLTSIEIIQHVDFYNEDKRCKNLIKEDDFVAIPSYKEVVKSTCTRGAYISLIHVYVASTALSIPILSHCPQTKAKSWFAPVL